MRERLRRLAAAMAMEEECIVVTEVESSHSLKESFTFAAASSCFDAACRSCSDGHTAADVGGGGFTDSLSPASSTTNVVTGFELVAASCEHHQHRRRRRRLPHPPPTSSVVSAASARIHNSSSSFCIIAPEIHEFEFNLLDLDLYFVECGGGGAPPRLPSPSPADYIFCDGRILPLDPLQAAAESLEHSPVPLSRTDSETGDDKSAAAAVAYGTFTPQPTSSPPLHQLCCRDDDAQDQSIDICSRAAPSDSIGQLFPNPSAMGSHPAPASSFRMFQHEVDMAIQMIQDELDRSRRMATQTGIAGMSDASITSSPEGGAAATSGRGTAESEDVVGSASGRHKLLILRRRSWRQRRKGAVVHGGFMEKKKDGDGEETAAMVEGVGDESKAGEESRSRRRRRSLDLMKYAAIVVWKLLHTTKSTNSSSSSSSNNSSSPTRSGQSAERLHKTADYSNGGGRESVKAEADTKSATNSKRHYFKCSDGEPAAAAAAAAMEVIRMMKPQQQQVAPSPAMAVVGGEADNAVKGAIEHCKKSSSCAVNRSTTMVE